VFTEYVRVTIRDVIRGAVRDFVNAAEDGSMSLPLAINLLDGTTRTLSDIDRAAKTTVFAAVYPSLSEALSAFKSGRPSRRALRAVVDAAIRHIETETGSLSERALLVAATRLGAQSVARVRGAAISVALRDGPPLRGPSLDSARIECANRQLALIVGLAVSAYDAARADVEPEAFVRGAALAIAARRRDFEAMLLEDNAEAELDGAFRRIACHLA
jgi:hypothetical protein